MKKIKISENDSGQRADKFLIKYFSNMNMPKSLLYKYIRKGRIKLNGKRVEISRILSEGDILELYINDEFFSGGCEVKNIGNKGDIEIIYQDEHIIIVNKPPGLIVHSDKQNKQDTLIGRILYYLYKIGDYDPYNKNKFNNSNIFTPALCNRLDRNTEGLVICAKSAAGLRIINEKLRKREIRKYYTCVVSGILQEKNAVLKHYIQKDGAANMSAVYDNPGEGMKEIIMSYMVISESNGQSLLEIELTTGRSHQIRAQLAHIGHPLVGDVKYGGQKNSKKFYSLKSNRLVFEFSSDAGVLNYLNGKIFRI